MSADPDADVYGPHAHDPELCATCNPDRSHPQRVGSLLTEYLRRRTDECAAAASGRAQNE